MHAGDSAQAGRASLMVKVWEEKTPMWSGGYQGKLLWVDLNELRWREEGLDPTLVRQYVGGSGLAARLLAELCPDGADPLGPDNPLVFMTGPLVGTKVPLSGRHQVACRSPATGIFGEADVGGTWGMALKRAGYDGIVFRGCAPAPVYLLVTDQRVEVRPASDLWGLDTYATAERLQERHGRKAQVACIGPAGEKLSCISGIVTDGKDARIAARCGVGAVMGAKRLKAVVADGARETAVADPERLKASLRV